jgi:predicted RNase H-like nuclease
LQKARLPERQPGGLCRSLLTTDQAISREVTARGSLLRVLVAGIDVWRKRWIAVVLCDGRYESAVVEADLETLLKAHPDLTSVGIDMPVGLTSGNTRREADDEARKFVGRRASSVFPTYPREVYDTDGYDEAREMCVKLTHGVRSISRQAYALKARLREVQRLVETRHNIYEVHPEVSFHEMAKSDLTFSKTSWNGMHERVNLLRAHGLDIPTAIPVIKDAGAEDILDAAAAAWSANRIANGTAKTLPKRPQEANGRQIAIWR